MNDDTHDGGTDSGAIGPFFFMAVMGAFLLLMIYA